ncbi:hypothetical protein GGR21_002709 [Dysgonomonas hofstadii]|uniref:Lipoprotein n=1 Tax=Dysgonomonas hofstadii TaxID=637886 RepID=A0A840CN29_9BACT|nr:hypothetical protein [Dysgonomonas hofstadii]MBB4036796.1 hypothetical protein [Dysgonomonas hofstadii]
MKSLLKISSLLLSFCFLVMSCSGSDDDDTGNGNGNGQEKPWDKSRTAKVLVISTLSEGNLFSGTDYTTVVNTVKNTEHAVVLLDRSNVSFTGAIMANPGVNVASLSKHIPVFVPVDKGNNTYTGNTVLFDQPIQSLEQRKVTDYCWLMKQDVNFTSSLVMNFSTVSFNAESQLDAGVSLIKSSVGNSTLIIGVVKRNLSSAFESKISESFGKGNYTLELMKNSDANSVYSIYVLGSPKWKFRELTEATVSGNIKSFLVQVEYLK